MQTQPAPASRTPADHAVPSPDAVQPYAEILARARSASSKHGFLAQALASIARALGSPFAALHAKVGAEIIDEETHHGPTDPGFWRPVVQQFLTDSLTEDCARAKVLSAKNASLKIGLLSAPLSDYAAGVTGVITLVARGGRTEALANLQRLEALAALTASSLGIVGKLGDTNTAANRGAAAQGLARAAVFSSPEELAFSITNGLRSKLGCDQVALGTVTRRRVRIISISGLDDVNQRSAGVARIREAMEECLDADQPLVFQADHGWANERVSTGHRLHQQWHDSIGGGAVASIPLHAGEHCTAILSLRRSATEPFQREQIEGVQKTVEPFAAALQLVRKANRSVPRHVLESVQHAFRSLITPGRLGTKIAGVAVLLAAAWFCFGTLDYEVRTAANIAPAEARHVAAPFEGTLASVLVLPGDVVHAGDVLCEFDQRELRLERSHFEAELAVLEREQTRAMASATPVEASLAEANARLTRTQLDLIDHRLERATCRATCDGVVVSGDLRKRVGSVLRQGEPLFEIAPLDRWRLELAVRRTHSVSSNPGSRAVSPDTRGPKRHTPSR